MDSCFEVGAFLVNPIIKIGKKEHFYEKLKWFSTILIVMLIGLYFGGKSKLRLSKDQKIPYTVAPTATGGFEATIDFFCFL